MSSSNRYARRTRTPATVFAAVAVACVFTATDNASALILSTYDGPDTPSSVNTTAPADDPGWANSGAGFSGIYLGDQWVLTAEHVNLQEIILPSGTYEAVPGSAVILTNPAFFDANGNGVANGFGTNSESLSSASDLKMIRIKPHAVTGLTPEQMDSEVRSITIATESVTVGTDVTAISAGARRVKHPVNPNGRWRFDSSFNLTADLNSPNEGFLLSSGQQPQVVREKAWGTNQINTTSTVPGMVDNGTNGIVRVTGLNDVVGIATRFDRGVDNDGNPLGDGGQPDEFQGAAGDSGGPVFEKDSQGQWVLRGVFHAIYAVSGQPTNAIVPMYGQHTAISDLSQQHYYDQIADLRASDLYSIMGDVDLDGQVTGEIINGVPTGDLSALVDGWLYQQSEADVTSWVNGDLNQDGLTDLSDFVLLRDALGGTIPMSSFAALVGVAAVPEPATAALLAVACLVARSRGRRR